MKLRHILDRELILDTMTTLCGAAADINCITRRAAKHYIYPNMCPACRVRLLAPKLLKKKKP